jgi:hypothetical protein
MSNDYFSFMADRKRGPDAQPIHGVTAEPNAFTDSDVVEFIEDPQMEVTESSISDTMIQRVFRGYRAQMPVALED